MNRRSFAALVAAGALFAASPARAYRVISTTLSVNDGEVADCDQVTVSIQVCIDPNPSDVPEGASATDTVSIDVDVRVVVDEWGEDRDYEKDQEDADYAVPCEGTARVQFTAQQAQLGGTACSRSSFVCDDLHPGTYDGEVFDPDFYACARSTDGENSYSGQIEIDINDESGPQPKVASLVRPQPGGTPVAVALRGDAGALLDAGFTLETEPGYAALLEAVPGAGFELETLSASALRLRRLPGAAELPSGAVLATAVLVGTEGGLDAPQLRRGGVSLRLADFDLEPGATLPSDLLDAIAVGRDLDGDGLPDALDPDVDGDGVENASDVVYDDFAQSVDEDGDGLGDAWETAHFGDLTRTPEDDSDGDQLDAAAEQRLGTDPTAADSDGDGADDRLDAFPLDASRAVDGDGDGVDDASDAFPEDPRAARDTDGDQVPDAFEWHYFGSLSATDGNADSDSDGASDREEASAGTHPTLRRAPLEFLGGGGESDEVDSLVVPARVFDRAAPSAGRLEIPAGLDTWAVDFSLGADARPSTLTLAWNGAELRGADGVAFTDDDPVPEVVVNRSAEWRRLRVSGLPATAGGELEVSVANAAGERDVDVLRLTEPASDGTGTAVEPTIIRSDGTNCACRVTAPKPSARGWLALLLGLSLLARRRRTKP